MEAPKFRLSVSNWTEVADGKLKLVCRRQPEATHEKTRKLFSLRISKKSRGKSTEESKRKKSTEENQEESFENFHRLKIIFGRAKLV